MKIHTTQNLNSLVQLNQQTTNSVSSKDFRLKNYSELVSKQEQSAESLSMQSSEITFGRNIFRRKKTVLKDAEKFIKSKTKKVGELKTEGRPEEKRGDKVITSSLFHKLLNVVEFETVVTASVAAVACAARAGTIMALPTKKNKEDNRYAASHAGASGIIGFLTAFILTAPFKLGSNYVMKNLKQHLSESTLKRLYPHLEIKSVFDEKGAAKPIEEWLDRKGNKFIEDMKSSEVLPELRNLADSSVQTLENVLLNGKQVDWAAQKGKSFNDVVLKDGKKLYDEINMSNLGIKVSEKGMGTSQIMLKDFDREYLTNLINDAKKQKNHWGDLDIKSVYNDKNEVVDFRQWKDVNGKQWQLNLDEVGVSSPYETADYRPRISGRKRYDKKDKEYKHVSYQNNGKDGKLGTPIENDMVEIDAANDVLFKLLTWGPDILFRVPVAATTIALIPWVLNNVFNIHKSSAKSKAVKSEAKLAKEIPSEIKAEEAGKQVAFKGKKPNEGFVKRNLNKFVKAFSESFGKPFAKYYGKPLIESERVYKASKWLSGLSGSMTQHMQVLGSFITSGVYMQQTLTKKDLDPDRRRTLSINQGLCFVVPTIAAYTVDKAINKWVKSKGYRLTGLTQSKYDIAKREKRDLKEIADEVANLGKKTKGIRTLSSITIFALIYRYITPVFMTPVANWGGDKLNAWLARRRETKKRLNALAEQQSQEQKTVAKEVELKPIKETDNVAKEVELKPQDLKQTA